MDYEKKYKEALAKAKEQYNYPCMRSCMGILEEIFPELKESEDEKVEKAIFGMVYDSDNELWSSYDVSKSDVLDWLEKQGKQKQLYIRFGEIPTDEKSKIYRGEIEVGTENGVSVYPAFKTDEGDIVLGLSLPITKTTLYTQQHLIEYDNRPCYLVNGDYIGKDTDGQPLINNVSIIKKIDSYRVKEKNQTEQEKDILDDAILDGNEDGLIAVTIEYNKKKPKFKIGDFIVNDYCMGRVVEITNDAYLLDTEQGIPFSCHSIRLWDVTKDAKDGDVLANDTIVLIVDHLGTFENRPIIYSWYFANSNKFYGLGPSEPDRWEVEGFYPATKEQREQLKKTMADAGYTFDFENKKLKKIEPKTEENKRNIGGISPNWSEEDKNFMYDTLSNLTELKDRYGEGYGNVGRCIDWIKSIKDRVQPKQEWSEEDDYYRNCIIQIIEEINNAPLKRREDWDAYITWLKSLRPQNKWKPSDEQMIALWCNCSNGSVLTSLYNDLKKLKEL